jgi:hypothetical protein
LAPAVSAALLVAAGSGVALALAYDPSDALASVARMLLADPAARFARSLHFWSALAFLALAMLAVWDRLRRSGSTDVATGAGRRGRQAPPHVAASMGEHGRLGSVRRDPGALFALLADPGALRGEQSLIPGGGLGALAAIPGIGLLAGARRGGDGCSSPFHHALTFTLLAV